MNNAVVVWALSLSVLGIIIGGSVLIITIIRIPIRKRARRNRADLLNVLTTGSEEEKRRYIQDHLHDPLW